MATKPLYYGGFSDWETALRFVAALSRQDRIVLVVDEMPYLNRSTPVGVPFEDTRGVLREELPATGGYARILTAVGGGRKRP